MSDLIQLVYVSTATRQLNEEDLTDLLTKTRESNQTKHITGMLLFDGASFMQVIEGDRDPIESLYVRIKSDPRHENIVTIFEKPIEKRQFPDWSMGFKNLSGDMLRKIEGVNDFFADKTCLGDVEQSRALRILEYFSTEGLS